MSDKCFCHIVDAEGNKYMVKDAEARAKVEALKETVDSLEEKVEELENSTPTIPDDAEERISDLEGRVDEIEGELEGIDSRISDEVVAELGRRETRIATIEANAEALEERVQDLETLTEEISEAYESLESDVERIARPIAVEEAVRVGDRVTTLESKVNGITLGIHSDSLLYVFVNGTPTGTGIALPEGASGDVTGYFDDDGRLILSGNIPYGTYVAFINENGSELYIGNALMTFNATYNLTNCEAMRITPIYNGGSYTNTVAANSGYEMKTISVTMGGVDITSTAVSGNNINIAKVTGDIVITAEATAQQLENYVETVGYVQGRIRASNGELDNSASYVEYEAMNYIPIEYGDKITIENIVLENAGSCSMAVYDSNKTFIKGGYMYAFVNGGLNGERSSGIISSLNGITATSGVAYIRFSGKEITANSIVTVEKN